MEETTSRMFKLISMKNVGQALVHSHRSRDITDINDEKNNNFGCQNFYFIGFN